MFPFPFPMHAPNPAAAEKIKAAVRTVEDWTASPEKRVQAICTLKDAATDGSPQDLIQSGAVEALVCTLTAEWPAGGALDGSQSVHDVVAQFDDELLSPRRVAALALAHIKLDLNMMGMMAGSAMQQMGARMAAAGLFGPHALPAMLADTLPRYRWGQNYGRVETTRSRDQLPHLTERLLSLSASCAGLQPPVGPLVVAACADIVLEGYGGCTPEALRTSEQEANENYGPKHSDPTADSFCRFWAHAMRQLDNPAEQGRQLVSKGLVVKLSKAPASWMSGKQQALAALQAALAH